MELLPSASNGLKLESILKLNKLATLDKQLILGKLGELNSAEIAVVDKGLVAVFDIHIYYRHINSKDKAEDCFAEPRNDICFIFNFKQLLRGFGVDEGAQKPDKRLHQRGKNLTKLFFG
jgi:hypothetical protein